MNRILIVSIACLPLACMSEQESKPTPTAQRATSALMLKASPGKGLSVREAKKAPAGDIVVAGRIGHVVKGFASLQLVDAALDYCNAGNDPMENCQTPWDYCCIPPGEKGAATMIVEAHGEGGDVLRGDAVAGLRLLDLIVVKGKLTRDEHGNVVVVATGWYRQERPDIPESVRWPE